MKRGIKDDRPEPHRVLAYARSLEEIQKHNELYKQGKSTFLMGLTAMSDTTKEDFDEEFPAIKFNGTDNPVPPNLTENAASSVNWTCSQGAAAASATAGVLEGLHKARTKKLKQLSIQEILDCSGSGCGSAGDFKQYTDYIMSKKGLVTDNSYPYTRWNQACSPSGKRFGNPTAMLRVPYCKERLLKALVAKGPVAARVLATSDFRNYREGEKV
uniref:Pept_C1 domain-containing protein n=1 Tax=Elaeophora elaphi TaxID=1147741 RepID=A0A0R3RJ49_9BILA